jgi:hypothetical protein
VSELPPPVTVSDFYLAAIHDRLGAQEPAVGEPVELREPAPPVAPPRPLTEPARPARKPSARKTPAGAPRTRTRKGA